jgi:hypothetical protein
VRSTNFRRDRRVRVGLRENGSMLSGRRSVESARLLASELTESQASLRVYLAAGGLALLGVALLVLTVWWWRTTRPESPVLGPLEVMSDRGFMKARHMDRQRLVDTHRPSGAMALASVSVAPEPIDLSVLARDVPKDFNDLREPAPVDLAALVAVAAAVDSSGDSPKGDASDHAPIDDEAPHIPGEWHAQLDAESHIDPLLHRAATAE